MSRQAAAWSMPYTVSATGLVHRQACHAADGRTYARREQALAMGRRLAQCCNGDVVHPRALGRPWF